ncbi:MAG: hypothetical protein ACFFCW_44600, partial [Candidatus Hodarchaeota archaeon]
MAKSSYIRLRTIFCLIGLAAVISRSCGGLKNKAYGADRNDTNEVTSEQSREEPIIMWYHSGEQKNTLSLKTALSSGLITHVLVKYRNPSDDTWHSKKWVREAIEIVKKSDAKLVWGRDLWARWAVKDAKFADLFDSKYYIKQIQVLRAEAKEMRADLVFLDTEPYGNSPMRQ